MNEIFLKMMYQQWQQGQTQYIRRWEDFAKMAAHNQSITLEQMTRVLKQYTWFKFN